jgi:hypothetical protein
MLIAISTRYYGATDNRGAWIEASANDHRVEHNFDYRLSENGNHAVAARQLCEQLNWDYRNYIGGKLDDGRVAWVHIKS